MVLFLSFTKIRLRGLPCAALKSVHQYQTTLFFSVTRSPSNSSESFRRGSSSIFDYILKTTIPKNGPFSALFRTHLIGNAVSPASSLASACPANPPSAFDFVNRPTFCCSFGCAFLSIRLTSTHFAFVSSIIRCSAFCHIRISFFYKPPRTQRI